MTPEHLAEVSPQLYHMAVADAWPSIERHGLLSTAAVLDLFGVTGEEREMIEARHRPESVTLNHPEYGTFMVRDQKPMSDSGLIRCLPDDLEPRDWYRTLNRRVFFWASEERVKTLLNAEAYRGERHTVLTIDTGAFLERYHDQVEVTTMNTGATRPYPHPRGHDTFIPLAEFDYEASRRKRGRARALAEVVVPYSVFDIAELVLRVEHRGGTRGTEVIFEP